MPAQASAYTPQLLTIDWSSGGVGGLSLGMLCIDIAANAGNVRPGLFNVRGCNTVEDIVEEGGYKPVIP
ncbi:hypothetical protein HaLaN_15681, partial [Haematococcus lacustris]